MSALKGHLDNYKFRWKNVIKRYIDTYPEKKVNGNATQNDRAYSGVLQIANELHVFKANLSGDILNLKKNIQNQSNDIDEIKNQYKNQKKELVSAIGNNKAAKPFKIDKYDENSESYINIVAYLIAIFSTSFFIYKQIKQ